jgi:hypothetical protein
MHVRLGRESAAKAIVSKNGKLRLSQWSVDVTLCILGREETPLHEWEAGPCDCDRR